MKETIVDVLGVILAVAFVSTLLHNSKKAVAAANTTAALYRQGITDVTTG